MELLPRYPQVEVIWQACEAHPRPEPRMMITDAQGWWNALYPVAEQAGLPLKLPHSPVAHSDKAIEGMHEILRQGGNILAWHDCIYRAVFEEGADIEDLDILTRCAQTCGADPSEFQKALNGGRHSQKPGEANRLAWGELSFAAVPSYRMGAKRLDCVEGVGITKERLERFLQAIK